MQNLLSSSAIINCLKFYIPFISLSTLLNNYRICEILILILTQVTQGISHNFCPDESLLSINSTLIHFWDFYLMSYLVKQIGSQICSSIKSNSLAFLFSCPKFLYHFCLGSGLFVVCLITSFTVICINTIVSILSHLVMKFFWSYLHFRHCTDKESTLCFICSDKKYLLSEGEE